MQTALFTHSVCLDHDPGPGHPECPDRLRAIMRLLEREEFALLDRREAPLATIDQIALAHPRDHAERLLSRVPEDGFVDLDVDTAINPASGQAALRAAGAVCAAIDAVMAGPLTPEGARNAFCAVRPPGHHAETVRAMGFCLFNSVAIGALHAQQAHGLSRVAVIDFDVHHGNGTQEIFWQLAGLLYASVHQSPLYPGTGAASERGADDNIVNVPLAPHAGSVEFRRAMSAQILPAIDSFGPELILISAGFDAHSLDPMAHLNLQEGDFTWATEQLLALADAHCRGRVVSSLEGGYNLTALASCTAAHVRALMNV
ncbi:MAG: histone deacetylase family protein [Pseudomonadota bacterium]